MYEMKKVSEEIWNVFVDGKSIGLVYQFLLLGSWRYRAYFEGKALNNIYETSFQAAEALEKAWRDSQE